MRDELRDEEGEKRAEEKKVHDFAYNNKNNDLLAPS